MFKVNELCSGYSGSDVLRNISFDVDNEIFAVLGANGAGKTTLLRTLVKLLPLSRGSLSWNGMDITDSESFNLPDQGIAYVPQENNVFSLLSVFENMSLGALVGERSIEERLEEMFDLFPRLKERQFQIAGSLSGGEGQMLAIARALMQEPKILLLDEPSAGLSPLFVDTVFEKIQDIHQQKNVSIVLAEQNATKTLQIADRVLVLSLGEVHLLKNTEELSENDLMEAYHI